MSFECVYGLGYSRLSHYTGSVPITIREAREHRLTFGKHKGKPICKVPAGYLKWLAGSHGPQTGTVIPLAAVRAARLILES